MRLKDQHTIADNAAPSPRPTRDHGDQPRNRHLHDTVAALIALGSSATPIVVPATELGHCEWCPAQASTGAAPLDAELVVAHRTAPRTFAHRGAVCLGCLGFAVRDAARAVAGEVEGSYWIELPDPQLAARGVA